tara:strand:- start:14353 stop:14910 length:558 start_codon:yes stop_codon:yes gene_type:complete
MSGLFEQMDADASAFADIKTEGGSKLSSLIHEAQKQKELQEQHEQAAKDAKKEFLRITRELIPSEMQEMGLERIDVDGNSVTLNQFCYASIPADKKEEAFNFLREIGQDDLIKNEVKISFGKGQDNEAGAFLDDCARKGLDPDQKTSVHPMTLSAWIKDRMASGKEVDLELFGAFVGTEAKIRRK